MVPARVGIVTTKGVAAPVPSCRTEVGGIEAWLANQKGDVAENEIPQGFFRLGSVTAAIPGTSETKFVWKYRVAAPERFGEINPRVEIARRQGNARNDGFRFMETSMGRISTILNQRASRRCILNHGLA
jgi:hypothetical protein